MNMSHMTDNIPIQKGLPTLDTQNLRLGGQRPIVFFYSSLDAWIVYPDSLDCRIEDIQRGVVRFLGELQEVRTQRTHAATSREIECRKTPYFRKCKRNKRPSPRTSSIFVDGKSMSHRNEDGSAAA